MADGTNLSGPIGDSYFNLALSLLSRQKDLSPHLLLALLSLTNLLGIVGYLNAQSGVSYPAGTVGKQEAVEKQALASTLISLLGAQGEGGKKEAALTGLLSALGSQGSSGRKLDPGALMSLVSSLAGREEHPARAQYASEAAPEGERPEGKEIKEGHTRKG
jgi:uncharacterized membrane protein (UPF0136 family)